MTTLNGGNAPKSENVITEEENDMIQEFLRTKGVIECPPAELKGGEMSPHSHEMIMDKRKEYRRKQSELKKAQTKK